ncbi:hypothetical protein [Streptosporangium sp. NPDC087985]
MTNDTTEADTTPPPDDGPTLSIEAALDHIVAVATAALQRHRESG